MVIIDGTCHNNPKPMFVFLPMTRKDIHAAAVCVCFQQHSALLVNPFFGYYTTGPYTLSIHICCAMLISYG
ncbi:hypothetical protein BX666DRAFT_1966966 [Dichotomocladium elegans]|nr:hypothetical protein BX666DRAFT_1966966 [Dichotomocladium elegans]